MRQTAYGGHDVEREASRAQTEDRRSAFGFAARPPVLAGVAEVRRRSRLAADPLLTLPVPRPLPAKVLPRLPVYGLRPREDHEGAEDDPQPQPGRIAAHEGLVPAELLKGHDGLEVVMLAGGCHVRADFRLVGSRAHPSCPISFTNSRRKLARPARISRAFSSQSAKG